MTENKTDDPVVKRISKDIAMFHENIKLIEAKMPLDKRIGEVVELSKMYASDSQSYLNKNDLYTSFSCISYAHGLLDAVLKIL